MRFRLSHIHDYNTFLAIDVWSYRVRSTAYKIEDDGICQELWYGMVRQGRQNYLEWGIVDMHWVASSIGQAIRVSTKSLQNTIEDIIVGFSSEYYEFDIITSQYIRADATSTLTMEEIDTMIKKIEKQSFQTIQEKMEGKYGKSSYDMRLISSILSSVFIDGRKVNNPIGFTGKTVKLTICNIFLPAAEFNIMRSIVASLDKKTISIIPMPLVYPRVIENTDYSDAQVIFIDIGHSYVTFLQSSRNEIEAFETHHFGFSTLYGELSSRYPQYTFLELEKRMIDFVHHSETTREGTDGLSHDFNNFFLYVMDLLSVFIEKQSKIGPAQYIVVNGACFSEKEVPDFFKTMCKEKCAFDGVWHILWSIVAEKSTSRSLAPLNYGLSIIAQDLLLTKKDPFIRILRYILYQYE